MGPATAWQLEGGVGRRALAHQIANTIVVIAYAIWPTKPTQIGARLASRLKRRDRIYQGGTESARFVQIERCAEDLRIAESAWKNWNAACRDRFDDGYPEKLVRGTAHHDVAGGQQGSVLR